ncbi:TPA: hypothetical protein ACH3X1_011660 [Trebouxia sp. C0004]
MCLAQGGAHAILVGKAPCPCSACDHYPCSTLLPASQLQLAVSFKFANHSWTVFRNTQSLLRPMLKGSIEVSGRQAGRQAGRQQAAGRRKEPMAYAIHNEIASWSKLGLGYEV